MRNKGITLIALVITIIVLLILVGITINLTIGEHGILNMAREAGKNYQNAAEQERQEIGDFFNEAQNIINGGNGNTNPGGGEETEDPVGPWRLADKVNVGDYVAYNPTDGVTDTSKLSYTSPVGTGSSHGNGYEEVTITPSSYAKWRVLSKNTTTGEVVLISNGAVTSNYFRIKGAIGYLYLEQELHSLCAIYGYGKGADTTKTFTYQTGGPRDILKTGTITGSGARSVTIEDINTALGYTPNPTEETWNSRYACFPTTSTETGISEQTADVTFTSKNYTYKGTDVISSDSPLYDLIFNKGMYYIASRTSYIENDRYYLGTFFHSSNYGGIIGRTSSC